MSLSSLVSRLLLIALLVLASAGSAFSGVRIALEEATARVAAAATEVPPCHGATSASSDTAHGQPQAPVASDCCKVGHCDGVCLQALPALPALIATASAPIPGPPGINGEDAPHPAPLLDRPQRPPIA